MSEAFERDVVAVVNELFDRLLKGAKLHGGDYRRKERYSHTAGKCVKRGDEVGNRPKLCDNRRVLDVTPHQGNPDFVLSLARGLLVIEAFQGCRDGVTVGDVAARTGLSRASARRLLLTLEMLGYASHSGSVYRLGSRVFTFGFLLPVFQFTSRAGSAYS